MKAAVSGRNVAAMAYALIKGKYSLCEVSTRWTYSIATWTTVPGWRVRIGRLFGRPYWWWYECPEHGLMPSAGEPFRTRRQAIRQLPLLELVTATRGIPCRFRIVGVKMEKAQRQEGNQEERERRKIEAWLG